MKRPLVLLLLLPIGLLPAQDTQKPDDDRAAIIQAALDYAEGFFEGNAGRMEQALHPLLTKRGFIPSQLTGGFFLTQMNSEMLTEITRTGRGKLDPDQRHISADVLDMNENTASAKVFTARFNDYLHLVKVNGRWRLVNVLWRPPVAQPTMSLDAEKEAIRRSIEDFLLKAELKDVEGTSRFVHPVIAKRTYTEIAPDGSKIIQELNSDTFLEAVRMGRAVRPNQPKPEIVVLDVYESMASVKLSSESVADYLHLAKIDGQWKIVNGLACRIATAPQSQ